MLNIPPFLHSDTLASSCVQAVLTDEQRISVQFSIQAIQSRTLYDPRINFPARSSSDRRNTSQQLVSLGDLKVDDESFRWLAQAYHLGKLLIWSAILSWSNLQK